MTEYIPPHWQICHVARQFKAAVAGPGVGEFMEVKRLVERKDGTSDYGEWCAASVLRLLLSLTVFQNSTNAELTDFGRKVRNIPAKFCVGTFNACLAVHL
jgi:hypothetical protein